MKNNKRDAPMVFTESGPTEWTTNAKRQFDEGMKILARMIAADIIKKRAATDKNKCGKGTIPPETTPQQ